MLFFNNCHVFYIVKACVNFFANVNFYSLQQHLAERLSKFLALYYL